MVDLYQTSWQRSGKRTQNACEAQISSIALGASVDTAEPSSAADSKPPSAITSLTSAHRLITYGTLGPGRPNHYRLAHLDACRRWYKGTINGRLVQSGWGAALGYPALNIDQDGDGENGTRVAVVRRL
jgi:hypothetical protein